MFPISDTQRSGRFPLMTFLLIFVNAIVFIWEWNNPDFESAVIRYALVPSNVNFNDIGSLYPFFTSLFLHADILHIGSNMWFLWVFGDNVESRLGAFFVPFYLICGVFANFIQYLLFAGSSIPGLGASGAIAGIMGAYLYLFPDHKIDTLVPIFIIPFFLELSAGVLLFYWFALQVLQGSATLAGNLQAMGGVAYFAHVGGFLSGILLAIPYRRTPNNQLRKS